MRRLLILLPLLPLLAVLLLGCAAAEGLSLKTSGQYFSFTENTFLITAPEAGEAEITVESLGSVYLRVTGVQLSAGENRWQWDGLGFHGEPMPRGDYDLRVRMADGTEALLSFTMGKPKQALHYALPQSDTLYQEDRSSWGIQLETSSPGKVTMELYSEDAPDTLVTKVSFTSNRGATRVTWNGKNSSGKRVAAGRYTARCYATAAPAYVHTFTLTIAEGKSPVQQVSVTGPIMPSRNATDEEIWALMTAPAVVYNSGEGAGSPIREKPSAGGKTLGYVHGKSCALQVLEITEDGKWARVGAWALERGNYIEGYVQVKDLIVVTPAQDYGILVDKQTQTLIVFAQGERIGTIAISTGLPVSKATLRQVTEAGSYLTVTRTGSFTTEGYHYDYPIRYNGANLLHTLGWAPSGMRRDYTAESAQLGTRASHGCVRMERFTEESPINAWWLWSHLRWNTRVIIMDDPAQRAADQQAYNGEWPDMPYTGEGTNSWD